MTIEKKNVVINKNFANYRIYLDELEEIVKLFSELKQDKERLVIETKFEKVSDVKELKSLSKESVKSISIYFERPSILDGTFYPEVDREFKMRDYGSSLYLSDNTSLETSVSVAIESIFEKNKNISKRVISWLLGAVYVLALVSYIFMLVLPNGRLNTIVSIITNGFVVISLALLVASFKVESSLFIGVYRHEYSSFWSRNKDAIFINIIFLVAGAILGQIAEVLLKVY